MERTRRTSKLLRGGQGLSIRHPKPADGSRVTGVTRDRATD